VNELLVDEASKRSIYPGQWTFLGSRVLVEAPDRVVIRSEHEVMLSTGPLRMERYAYFAAGRLFFRLGINLINVGERPALISFGYGDEPWVGEFGSAAGNIGWTERGPVTTVSLVDPTARSYAGILDTKSGLANYLGWEGSAPPNLVFFGNHAGTPPPWELSKPLESNEIFIGAEWWNRTIAPGETLGLRLAVGLAAQRPDGSPMAPPDVINPR
jgi:hypothetical protein